MIKNSKIDENEKENVQFFDKLTLLQNTDSHIVDTYKEYFKLPENERF